MKRNKKVKPIIVPTHHICLLSIMSKKGPSIEDFQKIMESIKHQSGRQKIIL